MLQYLDPPVKPSFCSSNFWYLASSALYCALLSGDGGAGGGFMPDCVAPDGICVE